MKTYFHSGVFRAISFLLAVAVLGLSVTGCEQRDKYASKYAPEIEALFSGKTPLTYGNNQTAERISIDLTRKFWGKNVVIKSVLFLPAGTAKVPVMTILHSSGGLRMHDFNYVRELLGMGVGAYLIDSFTGRGITSSFDNQGKVTPFSLVVDAMSGLAGIQSLPRVDGNRVGVIGFSKGGITAGATAMNYWLAQMPGNKLKYQLHIMVYPSCSVQPYDMSTTGAPVYMLLGEKDTYTGVEKCQLMAAKMKQAGANILVKVYAGAQHRWDAPGGVDYMPEAENYLKCLFEQQKDGSWTEKSSGISGMKNLLGPLYNKAVSTCSTKGAGGAYNEAMAKEAMQDIKAIVQKDLLRASPIPAPAPVQAPVLTPAPAPAAKAPAAAPKPASKK
ncbi:MAG TPA: dienelactone hydrolase family protein [Alphaproteobacteria bacterium]|nr:dienelactone hydrolase family protein [Alphaproteobacteria bacterium]